MGLLHSHTGQAHTHQERSSPPSGLDSLLSKSLLSTVKDQHDSATILGCPLQSRIGHGQPGVSGLGHSQNMAAVVTGGVRG